MIRAMARAATTADAFNAVAEPRRRQILDVLAAASVRSTISSRSSGSLSLRSRSTCACSERSEQSTSATSGRQRLYRLNGDALKPIHDWVKEYERTWSERFDQLDVVLEDLKRRRKKMAMTTSGTATVSLPADTQILITREFAAPRHLVYEAWTTPELVKRWWHANRGEMTVCEIDLRVGGTWRYVMVTPDGLEVAFHGEYREIVPNERLVSTEVYEGIPDAEAHAALDTLTLTEIDGRTILTVLVEHPTKEGRDAHINSGMEDGMQDAMDLLEQVASRSAELSAPVGLEKPRFRGASL